MRYTKNTFDKHITPVDKDRNFERANYDRFEEKPTLISERPETDKYEQEASRGNFGYSSGRGGYSSRGGRYHDNK